MKIKDAIAAGVTQLNNSPSARLDVEVLLAHVLGIARAELLTKLKDELDEQHAADLRQLLGQRAQNIPVAYLVGQKSFYGLNLLVNKDVLVPRPETEALVETAVQIAKKRKLTTIYEIGTGSGNIAVALAKVSPRLRIVASDISDAALEVARQNAERHEVDDRIKFIQSHLANHIKDAELIVANLPYIPARYQVAKDILHEPAIAVFAGEDGLDLYREMFGQAVFKKFRGVCLIELGERQFDAMRTWIENRFPHSQVRPICNIDRTRMGMRIEFS